ncbi:MAG TPA: Holliday junction resolvase RuvX [Candidatus Polarisedimenticolia bacterium]|nr:Holliday junction resolvase RuvX [Candidatus Polarisedimenticolia bacterium]
MRYLALDVGDRRIGLAVGDDVHGLSRPLRTLVRRSVVKDLAEIERVAREESVDALLIGLPLTLSGDEGHQAERVRRFASASEKLGLPVRLYDERHTSSEAELRGARDIDAGAATILLEDFLAQRAR